MKKIVKKSDWYVSYEKDKAHIRRMVHYSDGSRSGLRYPREKYPDSNIEDFVIRLNGRDPQEVKLKAQFHYNHAFISSELLGKYFQYLSREIPTRTSADTMFHYLRSYCLDFFITKKGIADPLKWHRHQSEWGSYLLNTNKDLEDSLRVLPPKVTLSSKVIRQIIFELNRFLKWLHNERPQEVPPLSFEPISKASLKRHEAVRVLDGETRPGKFIDEEDWKIIHKKLEETKSVWRFVIYLCYHYGLRRREAMGLKLDDVRYEYLSIERQYKKRLPDGSIEYEPVKDRDARMVPHYLVKPDETYDLIESMHKHLMHPDTISTKFKELVKELGMTDYVLKDSRSTSLTRMARVVDKAEDLRLAAGHANIETTYKYYIKDTRRMDAKDFKKKKAG